MTDDILEINLLKAHHADCWANFYKSRHLAVWRFVHRRVGCRQSSDDITAESFLGAIKAINTYQPRHGSLERWLYGIVRRKLADYLREKYREHEPLTFTPESITRPELPTDMQEQAQQVASVLGNLSPVERDVLIWMYQDRVSVREIAARLNRTEKAVSNVLYRARQSFREHYASSQLLIRS